MVNVTTLSLHTHGTADTLGITDAVPQAVEGSSLKSGIVTLWCPRAALLGAWQRAIYVGFDTRPRQRALVVQRIGE